MLLRSILPGLSLVIASLLPLTAHSQDDLRWKFQSGETLKYQVMQNMQTEMMVGGQKINTNMQQSMDMAWKVSGVTEQGDAEIAQTVDRVQMKMEGGPFGSLQFDTTSTEVPSNAIVKAMADVFRKIIGQEFKVTMKSTGKVQNVKVPEQLLTALSTTGAGSALNEDTLKQMMEQSSVLLPAEPVTTGQMWESSQQIQLPFGEMKVSSKMTYEGRDPATGMARIAMKPSISVTPKEGSPLQMTMKKSDGMGRVLFDPQRGRIVRSDLELTLEMQVTQQGQVIDQVVKQKTTMQLAQ